MSERASSVQERVGVDGSGAGGDCKRDPSRCGLRRQRGGGAEGGGGRRKKNGRASRQLGPRRLPPPPPAATGRARLQCPRPGAHLCAASARAASRSTRPLPEEIRSIMAACAARAIVRGGRGGFRRPWSRRPGRAGGRVDSKDVALPASAARGAQAVARPQRRRSGPPAHRGTTPHVGCCGSSETVGCGGSVESLL
jgi:hypothetical protein